MFASKSPIEHCVRGVVGIAAIAAAIFLGRAPGAVAIAGSLALSVVALVAFRGCPVCWTIGMGNWFRASASPHD
ncbi:hypothetical protein EAH87_14595 [Sphingomonas koreensis]|nr:hypothetical protein EAH87_14595 [Sphingomonas koreensis]